MAIRPIEQSLPLQLLQAREAAMAHFRPMLREHGLTEQQWRVVRVLASEDQLDTGELAIRAVLLGPSVSRILQSLESSGLITRAADKTDQRRQYIRLSKAGRAKFDKIGPESESLYQSIESSFGRDKLNALYSLLAEFTATTNQIR